MTSTAFSTEFFINVNEYVSDWDTYLNDYVSGGSSYNGRSDDFSSYFSRDYASDRQDFIEQGFSFWKKIRKKNSY